MRRRREEEKKRKKKETAITSGKLVSSLDSQSWATDNDRDRVWNWRNALRPFSILHLSL